MPKSAPYALSDQGKSVPKTLKSSILPNNFDNFVRRLHTARTLMNTARVLAPPSAYLHKATTNFLPLEKDWEENKPLLDKTIETISNHLNEDEKVRVVLRLKNKFPKGRLSGRMLRKNDYNMKKENEIISNVSVLLEELKKWQFEFCLYIRVFEKYPNERRVKKQFQKWEEWFLETNTPICEETLKREFPCIPNVLARRGIKGGTEIVFKDTEQDYDIDEDNIDLFYLIDRDKKKEERRKKKDWQIDQRLYLSRMGQLVYCLLFKFACQLLCLRDK